MTETPPPPRLLPILLTDNTPAYLVSHDEKRTTIKSRASFPPGATAKGTIDGVSAPFELKVRNCRKVEDWFFIDGRTQNATRELSAVLKSFGESAQNARHTPSAQKSSAPQEPALAHAKHAELTIEHAHAEGSQDRTSRS